MCCSDRQPNIQLDCFEGAQFYAEPQDGEPLELIRMTETHVRFVWRWVLMPLLFCLIGTIIDFNTLPDSTISRSVGVIFAGAIPGRLIDRFCVNWSRVIPRFPFADNLPSELSVTLPTPPRGSHTRCSS